MIRFLIRKWRHIQFEKTLDQRIKDISNYEANLERQKKDAWNWMYIMLRNSYQRGERK